MAETKKQKVIVREIEPKIKVREITEEEKEDELAEKASEESLEDITTDAPSSREFPEFSRQNINVQEQAREEEVQAQTPSGTTAEETRTAVRYQIQREITEREISRTYRSEIEGRQSGAMTSREVIPIGTDERMSLRSAERELGRGPQTEEEKYKIN